MYKTNISMTGVMGWLVSRVAVIYVIMFIFCSTCMDLKTLDARIKIRHLNDAVPDFSDMIIFSKDQDSKKIINWKPYKNYFELILHYLPQDLITQQLLGFVDYYTGQEQEAIALFKSSTVVDGKFLFWSNYNLGVIYYKKGIWPQAADYFLKAIASNPRLAVVLMQESIIYKQIFASPYFQYSLKDEINDAQSRSYILLLSSLGHMRMYDKMIVISKLCAANQHLSYKDAFYYYGGLAFFEMGKFKSAFLFFQKSLTLENSDPYVYYYMANIYQKAGQLEQARALLQVSFALHQKNDPRFPYDAQLNLRFF